MIVLLDTNVLISALLANGVCHDIFTLTIKSRSLISSEPLLEELQEIIERKLKTTPRTQLFLKGLRHHIRIVKPVLLTTPVCRDPDDDMVLATALAGVADFIVTGDDDLLVLKKHKSIRILSPREFWSIATK